VQEVGRLEQILKMILSYIRPVFLEFLEINLNEILEEAIKASQEKLRSRGIRLELDLAATLPSIQADRGHLQRAMENIIRNACKHTPKEAVLLISSAFNGRAVVQFTYPALHIEDDDIEHFFYPFVPGELEKTNLELPLTKVVIHRHGGIISINRNEQNMIVITITFPMARSKSGER
jgi:signal transduction histidine kinase